MKANELRIGNWVKWNYEESSDGNAYPVEYGYELDDIKNNPNIVKPIPLTEEWLERFGFDKVADNCWLSEKTSFYIDNREGHIRKGFVYYLREDSNDFIPIDYVHSLQNLYFALTGEELNQNK